MMRRSPLAARPARRSLARPGTAAGVLTACCQPPQQPDRKVWGSWPRKRNEVHFTRCLRTPARTHARVFLVFWRGFHSLLSLHARVLRGPGGECLERRVWGSTSNGMAAMTQWCRSSRWGERIIVDALLSSESRNFVPASLLPCCLTRSLADTKQRNPVWIHSMLLCGFVGLWGFEIVPWKTSMSGALGRISGWKKPSFWCDF